MSNFHADVSDALTRIRVNHSIEVETEDGLFSMDIGLHPVVDELQREDRGTSTLHDLSASTSSNHQLPGSVPVRTPQSAVYNGLKVAIEVDGRTHFTCNTRRSLGTTLARRRLLRSRNWHVISVPVFEWRALESGQEQERYMRRKMSGLGVLPQEP